MDPEVLTVVTSVAAVANVENKLLFCPFWCPALPGHLALAKLFAVFFNPLPKLTITPHEVVSFDVDSQWTGEHKPDRFGWYLCDGSLT